MCKVIRIYGAVQPFNGADKKTKKTSTVELLTFFNSLHKAMLFIRVFKEDLSDF